MSLEIVDNEEKKMDLNELMEKAKQEGEVFVTTLTQKQVEKMNSELGFDSDFEEEENDEENSIGYDHVDIYLMYDGGYKLKYVFDNNVNYTYYVHENDVFGRQFLLMIIKQYLSFSQ